MESITSRQNEKIKRLRLLFRGAAFRRAEGEYACEGLKLFAEARKKAEITSVFLTDEACKAVDISGLAAYIVPQEIIDHVSDQKNPQGIIFTCRIKNREMPKNLHGHYILLDSLADPGNAGTIMRTADALGLDGLLICGGGVDIYNPKVVRGAMGALFRLPVFELDYDRLEALLKASGIPFFRAHARKGAAPVNQTDLSNALVAIGNEANGLSERILSMKAEDIIIPMKEGAESLNAAAAASIIMWEMARG